MTYQKTLIFLLVALLSACGSALRPEAIADATTDSSTIDENCGNDMIDPGEACDGNTFGALNCQMLGFSAGELSCTFTCQLDTSGCSLCGNESKEALEACDGTDFGGATCADYGFEGGYLLCAEDCSDVDAANCSDEPSTCGNGALEPNELCDGAALRDQTCQGLGYSGGDLACHPNCAEFDVSGCWNTQPVCGNGIVEPGEQCDDGNQNNTDVCPDGINGTCQWTQCGDGFVWFGHEECDDGNHSLSDDCPDGPQGNCEWSYCGDGFTHTFDEVCDPLSYGPCNPDCQGFCGDGDWRPGQGELCDDGNNADDGDCTADCQGFCGDGFIDPGEQCDEGNEYLYPDTPAGGGPGCRNDCTPSSCGDGHCDCYAGENNSTCPGDCSDPTDPTCCGASGEICQPGSGGEPAACCADGCVQYPTTGVPGAQNCGSCGLDCAINEMCSCAPMIGCACTPV